MVKKRLLAATLSLGIITPIATSFHESKADNNIENIGDGAEVVKRTEDTSSDK
ncbi:TPA: gamma-hemolysin subunit A, partial [Staphylococcus aureus]|nr:gamma-hemolysin subunit A [Staphylococcus aureus]